MCACRVGKVVCACRVVEVVCVCRVVEVVCACRVVEVVCVCRVGRDAMELWCGKHHRYHFFVMKLFERLDEDHPIAIINGGRETFKNCCSRHT